jgi:hypothetical protein
VDYSEIPPWLQWLRGPRTLQAALEAYDEHLVSFPASNGDSAGSLVLQPDFVTCGCKGLDAERPPLDDHGL